MEGAGKDLGGREPPLERGGSLPPNLPLSPKTSPKSTRPGRAKICFALYGAGALGGSFFISGGRWEYVRECGFAPGWRAGSGTICGAFLTDYVPVKCETYQTALVKNAVFLKDGVLSLQTSLSHRELPPRAPAPAERRFGSLCMARVLLGEVFYFGRKVGIR